MPSPLSGRPKALRSLVLRFLSERLESKLEKLKGDDPKRAELQEEFLPDAWLNDAAHRIIQVQAVTHSLKPIHPDAKGSSLFREPSGLPPLAEVGSHCLGATYAIDVVGNAAALDVYKLLKLSHEGKSLLELAAAHDDDFCAALSDDQTKAQRWMAAFAGLAEPRGKVASHTNAKQIYWLDGNDAHDDGHFHLLAPLYPTSLVHRLYQTIQDDRFSEDAKAARIARKAGELYARSVREYQDLAIQQLGGTKPQNISQLNSERRGNNCLLASVPPVWKTVEVRPVLHVSSLFKVFGRRREVQQQARALRRFLESDPPNNDATRRQVVGWVNILIDELMQFTAELRTLPTGWSQSPECELHLAHRQWLDPDGAEYAIEDGSERVAEDFALWLNGQLRDPLPMGDPEFLRWRNLARDQFKAYEREAA